MPNPTTDSTAADDTPPPTPRWRRVLRIVRRVVQWTVQIVLLLVVLLLIAIHTDAGRAFVLDMALEQVNSSIRGELKVDKLEGTVFGDLSLQGVQILAPDGTTALEADTLSLEFAVWPLLSEEVRVERIEILRPRFVVTSESGDTLIAQAFEPVEPSPQEEPTEPSAWVIDVQTLVLEDFEVLVAEADDAPRVAGQLSLSVHIEDARISWTIDVDAALDNLPVDAAVVSTTGHLADGQLVVETLEATTPVAELALAATVALDNQDIALDLQRLHIPALSAVAAIAGPEAPDLVGAATVSGSLDGNVEDAAFDIDVDVADAGTIALRGRGGMRDGEPWWSLTVTGDALRPQTLMPEITIDVVSSFVLTSSGRGNPTADGQVSADLDVSALSINGVPNLVPLPARLTASMKAGDVEFDLQSGPGPVVPISAVGTATLAGAAIEGSAKVTIDTFDPKEILRFARLGYLSGQVSALTLDVDFARTAEGALTTHTVAHVSVADLAMSFIGKTSSTVGAAVIDATMDWRTGDRLPTGDITLVVTDANVGVQAKRLSAALEIGAAVDGKQRVEGVIDVTDLRPAPDVSIAALHLPVALDLGAEPATDMSGTIGIEGDGIVAGAVRVKSVRTSLAVSATADGLNARGLLVAKSLRQGTEIRVPTAKAQVDVTRHADQRISGRVKLNTSAINLPSATRLGSLGGRLRFDVTPGDKSSLTVSGNLSASDIEQGEDMELGRADAVVDIYMRDGSPVGNASVDVTSVRVGETTVDALHAELTADRQGNAVGRVVLNAGENTLTANVRGRPFDRRQSYRLRQLELDTPNGGLHATGASRVSIETDGSIVIDNLQLEGTGELGGRVEADGRWNARQKRPEGSLVVEDVDLQKWIGVVTQLANIEALQALDIEGTLDMEARVDIVGDRPQGVVDLELTEGRYADLVRDLDVSLGLEVNDTGIIGVVDGNWNEAAELSLQLDIDRSLVSLSPFEIRETKGVAMEIDGTMFNIDLADFRHLLPDPEGGLPLAGIVNAQFYADGTLDDPRVVADVSGQGLSYGPIVDNTLDAHVFLDHQLTELRVLLGTALGQERLTLRAEVPFNPIAMYAISETPRLDMLRRLEAESFSVTVRAPELAVADFPFTAGLPPIATDAIINADLSLEGTLKKPIVEGSLNARSRWFDKPLGVLADFSTMETGMLTSVAIERGDNIVARGLLVLPDLAGLLSGEQRVATLANPDTRLTLDLRLSSEELAELMPASVSLESLFNPELVLRLEANGGAAGPVATFDASVAPSRNAAEEGLEGFDGRLTLHADVTPTDATAKFELFPRSDAAPLKLVADLDIGTAQLLATDVSLDPGLIPIAIRLTSDGMPLDFLSNTLPDIFGDTEGTLRADLLVGGTLGTPKAEGRVDLDFAILTLVEMGLVQRDAALNLAVSDDVLRLEPTTWKRKDGRLDLSAELGLGSLRASKMSLAAAIDFKKYRILGRKDLQAVVSGQIAVAGTLAAPRIEGRIVVDEGLLRASSDARQLHSLDRPTDVIYTNEIVADGAIATAIAERSKIHADITVVLPRNSVRVRHLNLDLEPWGEMVVRLRGPQFSIEGRINGAGIVTLYNRDFTIADGSSVILTGGEEINPLLELTAEYDISEVDLSPLGLTARPDSRIYVDVQGTADKPKITLRSNPQMDETNIASIIALGEPVGADTGNAVQKQTATLFVALATGRLANALEDDLPVDVFRLSTSENLETATLTVGKRVSKDLTVLYRSNIGGDEQQSADEVVLRYDITTFLKLEGLFGLQGEGAVDLLLQWSW